MLQLVKDTTSSTRDTKGQNFPVLRFVPTRHEVKEDCILMYHRCLYAVAEKITQSTAMEDKRFRKELQVSLAITTFHPTSQKLAGHDDQTSRQLRALCWTVVRSKQLDTSKQRRCNYEWQGFACVARWCEAPPCYLKKRDVE
jgi:hypothetical protein